MIGILVNRLDKGTKISDFKSVMLSKLELYVIHLRWTLSCHVHTYVCFLNKLYHLCMTDIWNLHFLAGLISMSRKIRQGNTARPVMTGLCGCGRAREGKPHDLWQTLGENLTKTIETKHSEKKYWTLRIIGPSYGGVWPCFPQGSGISKPPVLRSHDS